MKKATEDSGDLIPSEIDDVGGDSGDEGDGGLGSSVDDPNPQFNDSVGVVNIDKRNKAENANVEIEIFFIFRIVY